MVLIQSSERKHKGCTSFICGLFVCLNFNLNAQERIYERGAGGADSLKQSKYKDGKSVI